jgi:hypothetical protein
MEAAALRALRTELSDPQLRGLAIDRKKPRPLRKLA